MMAHFHFDSIEFSTSSNTPNIILYTQYVSQRTRTHAQNRAPEVKRKTRVAVENVCRKEKCHGKFVAKHQISGEGV